ncbi:uncharacterized protein LOC134230464 [Saccostrea cucullata]|uniref:uncharacterized protein LOC134230464 n=1 Tax=Saccostrea cuccullata TaxID=36930 RepID=UPI002ED69140
MEFFFDAEDEEAMEEDAIYFDVDNTEDTFMAEDENKNEGYWDDLVHKDSTVTRAQSLLMLILFTLKHHLTKVATADLLELLDLHLPNLFPKSTYFIEKFFNVSDHMENIEKHYFCVQCEGYIGKEFVQDCVYCGFRNQRNCEKSANFFMMMPLRTQLEHFLKVHGLPEINRSPEGILSNIRDGEAYRRLVQDGTIGQDDLTLQWNCDGIPVFKSSGYSIWPIQLIINECVPSDRKDNIMLAALWFGNGKPRMDTYLQPFVNTCAQLSEEGITWIDTNGRQLCTKVHTILCSSDSIARPPMRNVKQFNGQYGCDWCLHPGEVVHKGDGHVRAYPPGEYRERTHDSFVQDGLEACTSTRVVNGVKGLSPLCLLTVFNMVIGFVPDYLHSVCQGVVKQFMSLWLDSSNHGKPFYIGLQSRILDQKLLKLKPPFEITRRPRTLSTRRFWKASEWRAFLLFYSMIVLPGVLPQQYVNHFFLLVFGIYTLLQSSVTLREIDLAERALRKFVFQVQTLYGVEHMSFNVHQLLHVAQSVRNWGPIWGISTFPFEGNGGNLLKMFNGTQYVSDQICKSLIMFQEAKKLSLLYLANAPDDLEKIENVLMSDEETGTSSFFLTKVKETQSRVIVNADNFQSKCLYLIKGNDRFVICLPNHYEWD